jgi:thiol-disulfide isomerase/thioredoxin
MTYLTVAVTGVAALSLVNTWLIIAMARKLRGHGEELARRGSGPRPVVGLPPGTRVPDFTVTTMTGATVSAEDLRGERSVVAFFSPGCAPCHEQAPAFAAFARARPDSVTRTLAVICGGHGGPARGADGDASHFAEQLADVTEVVREPSAGIASAALAVSGFPSFILIDADGRVEAGAHAVAAIVGIAARA